VREAESSKALLVEAKEEAKEARTEAKELRGLLLKTPSEKAQ